MPDPCFQKGIIDKHKIVFCIYNLFSLDGGEGKMSELGREVHQLKSTVKTSFRDCFLTEDNGILF